MKNENFINLVKGNTCFKGKGSFIDLILTNRRYFFNHTSSTEISDHHHLNSSMMKTIFEKEESKVLAYRDYKNFNFNNFKSELWSKRHHNKVFCGNEKPHLNKSLREAIMKGSRLKNEANIVSIVSGDLSKYKKQRNLVVKLNKKHRKEYFENLNVATNSKPFWGKCKLYLSKKHAKVTITLF